MQAARLELIDSCSLVRSLVRYSSEVCLTSPRKSPVKRFHNTNANARISCIIYKRTSEIVYI